MRLAILAPHFPEYAQCYASAMAAHGHVLAIVDEIQFAQEFAGQTAALPEGVRMTTSRFKTPRDFLRIYLQLRRFKPQLIHFQEAAGPRRALFNAAIAAIFRRRAAIVLTVHDPVAHSGRDAHVALRTAAIAGQLRRSADCLVTHGAFCARQLATLLPAAGPRILISAHGLILEPSKPEPPPQDGPLRLYFFGRMEAYKGLGVLLEASRILHAEGTPFTLAIAGNGPELTRLQTEFARLPEVTVNNSFVPRMKIIADIQAAECVVLPYLSATQSGVLAAAYAGRRYVLASDTGGLPDIVKHRVNGLLVPPGDAPALAGAIRALVENAALRETLLQGARTTAQETLNWRHIADALATAFQKLARVALTPSVDP